MPQSPGTLRKGRAWAFCPRLTRDMIKNSLIAEFLSERAIGVIGASNARDKFGRLACRELKARGYRVFPVNLHEEQIEGEKCYRRINELPGTVHRILVVLPPIQTERIVMDLNPAFIRHVWMQNGAESPEAIGICRQKGIGVIHGECILMHAEPVRSYHLLHRLGLEVLHGRRRGT
jgi:uncharacterized protein